MHTLEAVLVDETPTTVSAPAPSLEMAKTIIIVSPEDSSRAMIAGMLKMQDYTVAHAHASEQTIAEIAGADRPSLIIVGADISDMHVTSFIKSVRLTSRLRYVPILVIATDKTLHKQMEWKEAGATGWLLKPFTAAQLLNMVNLLAF
ncbi:MAG: response regulator [Deltaproteobacteria bacterium]|nr:response regulator [Deltaproteobacteria bacterium]